MRHARLFPILLLVACDNGGTPADTSLDDALDSIDTSVDEGCVVDAQCMTPDAPCITAACHAPPYDVDCLGGRIVDEAGTPLACQAVVACTEGTCYYGRSNESGFWTVGIPAPSIPDIAVYFPVAYRIHHSPFCYFTDLCDGSVAFCDPFVLYSAPTSGTPIPTFDPETHDIAPLAADLRVEAGDTAAITFPSGAEIKMPFYAYEWGWIALTRFPIEEHVPCFIDPTDPPLALYVTTPFDIYSIEPGTTADPVLVPAALDLPNTSGLSAGTVVDIYVVGGMYGFDVDLHEGEWAAFTTATVTTDGSRIQTAPTSGLGYFSWFGVYAP